MKKSTIWILTALIAGALSGLLYIQITYMNDMIQMRNDHFSENVNRSIRVVVDSLRKDNIRYFKAKSDQFIKENVNITQYDVITQFGNTLPQTNGVNYNILFNTGVRIDLRITGDGGKITESRDNQGGNMGQNPQMTNPNGDKSLLKNVIMHVLEQTSDQFVKRTYEERADSTLIRNYLKRALSDNGIKLPFEFAVSGHNGKNIYQTNGYQAGVYGDDAPEKFALFHPAATNDQLYLSVVFPTQNEYVITSMKFTLTALIFTVILIIVFTCTIVLVFRQKKLTEMKNDFINNMTHEFKTPISSISLAAQMLNDASVRKSPTMLQHISTVINDETKRLRFQVEKVLQMSMFDRQKASLRLAEIDANNAIANITSTFKLKVERYGGTIETNLNAKDAIVTVDEMHFTNVIFNLLDNAVKYRKEEGEFSLVVTTKDVSDNKLQIAIKDNGIGIKKDDLKKIFEKFYRVSTGNRHDVKGFGLGLAYVKKMVNEFNGDIQAESEYGKGTKFIITLPLIKN